MTSVMITGGAGFIGSFITEELVKMGFRVRVIDNLSSGDLSRLNGVLDNVMFIKDDLKKPEHTEAFKDTDVVFHLAANPEVRISVTEPRVHFDENILATFNVLELMRKYGINTMVYASSSTVYGDASVIPTPEDYPLQPISVYGAAKAAGEIMCATYARLYGIKCLILRYANIVGPRLRHGAIYDLLMKLNRNPQELEVLGDGTQEKSYLYVKEAVDATIKAWQFIEKYGKSIAIYNVGNRDTINVKEIVNVILNTTGLKPRVIYKPATRDGRGWPGDVKKMLLSIERIVNEVHWEPKLSSREAVELTTRELMSELNLKW